MENAITAEAEKQPSAEPVFRLQEPVAGPSTASPSPDGGRLCFVHPTSSLAPISYPDDSDNVSPVKIEPAKVDLFTADVFDALCTVCDVIEGDVLHSVPNSLLDDACRRLALNIPSEIAIRDGGGVGAGTQTMRLADTIQQPGSTRACLAAAVQPIMRLSSALQRIRKTQQSGLVCWSVQQCTQRLLDAYRRAVLSQRPPQLLNWLESTEYLSVLLQLAQRLLDVCISRHSRTHQVTRNSLRELECLSVCQSLLAELLPSAQGQVRPVLDDVLRCVMRCYQLHLHTVLHDADCLLMASTDMFVWFVSPTTRSALHSCMRLADLLSDHFRESHTTCALARQPVTTGSSADAFKLGSIGEDLSETTTSGSQTFTTAQADREIALTINKRLSDMQRFADGFFVKVAHLPDCVRIMCELVLLCGQAATVWNEGLFDELVAAADGNAESFVSAASGWLVDEMAAAADTPASCSHAAFDLHMAGSPLPDDRLPLSSCSAFVQAAQPCLTVDSPVDTLIAETLIQLCESVCSTRITLLIGQLAVKHAIGCIGEHHDTLQRVAAAEARTLSAWLAEHRHLLRCLLTHCQQAVSASMDSTVTRIMSGESTGLSECGRLLELFEQRLRQRAILVHVGVGTILHGLLDSIMLYCVRLRAELPYGDYMCVRDAQLQVRAHTHNLINCWLAFWQRC